MDRLSKSQTKEILTVMVYPFSNAFRISLGKPITTPARKSLLFVEPFFAVVAGLAATLQMFSWAWTAYFIYRLLPGLIV